MAQFVRRVIGLIPLSEVEEVKWKRLKGRGVTLSSCGFSEKRGLDLGLSRGFSGSQAAKHLMGLSAASFANGPGRKRRFADETQ
ncbi:hypothetical protein AVEN_31379-1 [Araneus ventricosus]|uniref:Diuretic hormone class 2 n=1 Tax=Araneus ventricosus TaxID=182803 RepID=A0A4Y2G262_ARAVE|nr:hypothetical protein AVEN_31379-1 [Araneus ventricosus]